MRLKLHLTFNDEERQKLLEFQEAVNAHGEILSLEEVAKRAIYYAINDAWKRARNELAKEITDVTKSRVTAGDTSTSQLSQDAHTDLVAEKETSGDPATGST